MKSIVILAGETSGDLLGKELVANLKKKYPHLQFSGIAGPFMRKEGVVPWYTSESFGVMGPVDVLKKALFLISALRRTIRSIIKSNPDAVITIDQPSFSIACAKRLRARGYTGKIIQVVAPTVWAYKPQRAATLAQYFDLILPLYRFETDFFEMNCLWVGHPLSDSLLPTLPDSKRTEQPIVQPHGSIEKPFLEPTLALFPGSRPGEIKRNLPLQLQAAALITRQFPEINVAISLGEVISPALYRYINGLASKTLSSFSLVPFADRYALMRKAKAAFAKSGTITLELALHRVPFVCCYKTGWLTELYAKYILGLKPRLFALPNILMGTHIFPECIIPPVTPEALKEAILPFLCGQKTLPDLHSLWHQIDPGEPVGQRMAQAIVSCIGSSP